jgi:hypothetical protein
MKLEEIYQSDSNIQFILSGTNTKIFNGKNEWGVPSIT